MTHFYNLRSRPHADRAKKSVEDYEPVKSRNAKRAKNSEPVKSCNADLAKKSVELYELVQSRNAEAIKALLSSLSEQNRFYLWTDERIVGCSCTCCDAREMFHTAGVLYRPSIKKPEMLGFLIDNNLITNRCLYDHELWVFYL